MKIIVTEFNGSNVYLPFEGDGADVSNAELGAIGRAFASNVVLTTEGTALSVSADEKRELLKASGVIDKQLAAAEASLASAKLQPDEVISVDEVDEMTPEELAARKVRIDARLKAIEDAREKQTDPKEKDASDE